jgi:signal transduction histidine kinase
MDGDCSSERSAAHRGRHGNPLHRDCGWQQLSAPGPHGENRQVRVARALLAAGGLVTGLIVLFAVRRDGGSVTTYGATSTVLVLAGMIAGAALVAAGALTARAAGALAIAAAIAWWAPDLVGWEGGPTLVRSIAAVVAPFLGALVLHLAAAFPRATPRGRPARALVGTAYLATAAISLGRAAFRDPFDDLQCWSNCTVNVLLVHADRALGAALDGALLVNGAVIAAATLGVAAGRVASARGLWPVLAPCGALATADLAYAAALMRAPVEDPERLGFASLYLTRSIALSALGAGLVWLAAGAARRRAAVARLATVLGPAPQPGRLARVLADSLHAPGLEVGYWLPGGERLVDAHGRALELPTPRGPRVVTRVMRGGEPVAAVVHDAALLAGPELEREFGAAARLAVDNERLQAAVLAQLDDLRASRARIVERADAERRRLERALHDGVQQRLLALLYELRLARAEAADEAELEPKLAVAVAQAESALEELRDLAHGLYPAILSQAGLAPALETLADVAPIPVELGELTGRRHDDAVETTAYLVIARAVDDAARRGASHVGVAVAERDGAVVIDVSDDAGHAPPDIVHLADRAGALGGRADAAPGRVRVELPCA